MPSDQALADGNPNHPKIDVFTRSITHKPVITALPIVQLFNHLRGAIPMHPGLRHHPDLSPFFDKFVLLHELPGNSEVDDFGDEPALEVQL